MKNDMTLANVIDDNDAAHAKAMKLIESFAKKVDLTALLKIYAADDPLYFIDSFLEVYGDEPASDYSSGAAAMKIASTEGLVPAIKYARNKYSLGLKEAKWWVEQVMYLTQTMAPHDKMPRGPSTMSMSMEEKEDIERRIGKLEKISGDANTTTIYDEFFDKIDGCEAKEVPTPNAEEGSW